MTAEISENLSERLYRSATVMQSISEQRRPHHEPAFIAQSTAKKVSDLLIEARVALARSSERIAEAVAAERERCAKLLEDQAELETNSLHCGDNSMTIHSTNRYAADLRRAAKLIRASVSGASTEDAK